MRQRRTTIKLFAAVIAIIVLAISSFDLLTPDSGVDADEVIVVDGDTLRVTIEGTSERVRILGIDTPERGECGAEEATAYLTQLVGEGPLSVVPDPVADLRDRYDRILAYVEVDGADVGLALVEAGYAVAWWPNSAPTPTRGLAYQHAQTAAEKAGKGSWATCTTIGR